MFLLCFILKMTIQKIVSQIILLIDTQYFILEVKSEPKTQVTHSKDFLYSCNAK